MMMSSWVAFEADQVDQLEFVGAAPADQLADVADGDLLRELRRASFVHVGS